MKVLAFEGYKISAITTCVPAHEVSNEALHREDLEKMVAQTGIHRRRIVGNETAGDLCFQAAKAALNGIDVNGIGVVVLVTQYPDYWLPATVHILKDRLGLSHDCIAVQANEGCAGYVYGMQLILSLMHSSGAIQGLLLAGDTTSKLSKDASVMPLFGDAGSATIINKQGIGKILVATGSDGSGYKDIIVAGGGFRNPNIEPSLAMNGLNVFVFAVSRVCSYISEFMNKIEVTTEDIGILVLHQANKMMNDRMARKLGFDDDKVLSSLEDFGNTSVASLPLTLTTQMINRRDGKLLAAGFGVGLAWGMLYCHFENVTLQNIEYENE